MDAAVFRFRSYRKPIAFFQHRLHIGSLAKNEPTCDTTQDIPCRHPSSVESEHRYTAEEHPIFITRPRHGEELFFGSAGLGGASRASHRSKVDSTGSHYNQRGRGDDLPFIVFYKIRVIAEDGSS